MIDPTWPEVPASKTETDVTPDPINPAYYKAGGFEVADIADAYDLNRWLTFAIKHILRSGRKGEALKDLKKARWYISRQIENIEKMQGKTDK